MTATATSNHNVLSRGRKLVPLSRLRNAPHNPPGRLRNIQELADSLDTIGLLHPLTITPDYQIIDGHRRCAAAELLGWQDIECNIADQDPALVYASVNATARRVTGNDSLSVWLADTHAVPEKLAKKYAAMTNVIGRKLVKSIAAAGYTHTLYGIACQVARYCSLTDPEDLKAMTQWLLETATISVVRNAMRMDTPPAIILEALCNNKDLVFTARMKD